MPIMDRNDHPQIGIRPQRSLVGVGQQFQDGSVTSSDTWNGDAGINHPLGIGDDVSLLGIRGGARWWRRQPPI